MSRGLPTPFEVNDVTRGQVYALKSFGTPNEDIAIFFNTTVKTLKTHFHEELDKAEIGANAEVAKKLYKKATVDEDMTAIIFWLKTRARWRTADNTSVVDSNEELQKKVAELNAKLDAQNKKEY